MLTIDPITQAVAFENDGALNMDFVRYMGVSVKENDSPIGYFGTGLKYAIAVLLRNDCSITIMSGQKIYTFSTKTINLRGQDFESVIMSCDGVSETCGFTTELGKRWDMWCAYREIYCNMLDEGGQSRELQGESLYPQDNRTKIVISGRAFMAVHNNRDDFILNSKPLAVVPGLEIHPRKSKFIFYKGIRAYTSDETFNFTYNITKTVDLSEDRNIRWLGDITRIIAESVASCTNVEVIETLVDAEKSRSYERILDFGGAVNVSDVFKSTVQRLITQGNITVNETVHKVLKTNLHEHFGNKDNHSDNPDYPIILDKALRILADAGFAISHTIHLVKNLGNNVHGSVIEDKIYLADVAFECGMAHLIAVLIEERAHAMFGYRDESRNFQNYLVKELGKQIVKHSTVN